MGSLQSAHHHSSEPRESARNPLACAALTVAVAAVFWVGLIWAAVRLYG